MQNSKFATIFELSASNCRHTDYFGGENEIGNLQKPRKHLRSWRDFFNNLGKFGSGGGT